ncbi:MAG: CCA tRNA nucleotidyltransferase [Proteobacteria bacterium]|nr:CCA tRNA nucleotidyltransferase [Pseudomonadota bacterium]
MADLSTQTVLRALGASGAEVRFIGGCVRDAILQRPINDIDIATTATPDEVIDLLAKSAIKALPTGLDHGTVTAVIEHKSFEITTLRRDVETDGRHAVVAYTKDWREDAERRDLTMNALSLSLDGIIHDYVDGYEDALSGTVKFIGDATTRIKEDVLRLLRFYRFFAHYGAPPANEEARAACRTLAPLLSTLSGERIRKEFFELLGAEDPTATLYIMRSDKIFAGFLPEAENFDHLTALIRLEIHLHPQWPSFIMPDAKRRLAALLGGGAEAVLAISDRLKMSNADRKRLHDLACGVKQNPQHDTLQRTLYEMGSEHTRDRLLLEWAIQGPPKNHPEQIKTVATWRRPEFPLTGGDVLTLGVEAGPTIGLHLKSVENWWVDQAFTPDRTQCLDHLRAIISRT